MSLNTQNTIIAIACGLAAGAFLALFI